MKIIDVSNLPHIGSGCFSDVYRLSPRKIIKVYTQDPAADASEYMIEEIELSKKSKYTLPVLDVAIAKRGKRHYYAVIKRYIPKEVSYFESERFKRLLPKVLRVDAKKRNIRKDSRNRMYLIDTQGPVALGTPCLDL